MLSCDQLHNAVTSISLVEKCDRIKNGMLRLATPFKYPDGSQIDVFLGAEGDLFDGLYLTDLGQTTASLLDMHIKAQSTKKRKTIVTDVCNMLGVIQVGGEFRVNLENIDAMPGAIVRLAQACIRVSDLMFTQRMVMPGGFKDDVEELISSLNVPYEYDPVRTGQFNNQVVLDFATHGTRVESLIMTISGGVSGPSHIGATEVFSRWYDLANLHSSNQFISVIDSTYAGAFREEDIGRLTTVSTVLSLPDQAEEFKQAIAA